MFRRLLVVALWASSLAVATSAFAQTVDEIVARNIEAKGGLEKLRAVQTMKRTVSMNMQGTEGKLVSYGKRPNLSRQEVTITGRDQKTTTIIHAYNGTTAWVVNPLSGSTAPMVVTGPLAEEMRGESDFDDPLVDYRARGYRIDFVGTEVIGSRRAYHLRVTDRAQRVHQRYLDVETGLEMKVVMTANTGSIEQELSDYRDVDGVKIPFSIRTTANGVQQSLFTVEKVEFNIKIDDAIFRMGK